MSAGEHEEEAPDWGGEEAALADALDEPLNSADELLEEAEMAGIPTMMIPAPLPGAKRGNGSSEWPELYKHFIARFLPRVTEYEIAVTAHGFPDVEAVANQAHPSVREEAEYDVALEREGPLRVSDEAFLAYCTQFIALARDLAKRYSEVSEDLPAEDPDLLGEYTFRGLEAEILDDLMQRGAAPKELKLAHCLPARMCDVSQKDLERHRALGRNLKVMRDRYRIVCEMMRKEPSPAVTVQLEALRFELEEQHDVAQLTGYERIRGLNWINKGKKLDPKRTYDPSTANATELMQTLKEDQEERERGERRFPVTFRGTSGARLAIKVMIATDVTVPDAWLAGKAVALQPSSLLPRIQDGSASDARRLPPLREAEVRHLLARVSPYAVGRQSLEEVSGWIVTNLQHGNTSARFEVVCTTSKDAHDLGRKILSHRLENAKGVIFDLMPKRTRTREDDPRVSERDSESEEEVEEPDEASESELDTALGDSSGAGNPNGAGRKLRGKGQSRRMGFSSDASSLLSEDVEDLICEQCHRMYDRDNPNANGDRWPNGIDGLPGLTIATMHGRFCSLTCRTNCKLGENPVPWCKELRQAKNRRTDLDEPLLLLLQAHETQWLREAGELEKCEAEIKARKESKGEKYVPLEGLRGKELDRGRQERYGGESEKGVISPVELDRYRLVGLTKLSRVNKEVRQNALKEWFIKRRTGEQDSHEASAFVMQQARSLRNVITEEVRRELEQLDEDDPDYKRKAFRIQCEYVLRGRRDHEVAAGESKARADKQHKDRVRCMCSWAEKAGTIEKRVVVGPQSTEPTLRAKTERKKRCKQDGQKWAKDLLGKLKIVAHLSYWTYRRLMRHLNIAEPIRLCNTLARGSGPSESVLREPPEGSAHRAVQILHDLGAYTKALVDEDLKDEGTLSTLREKRTNVSRTFSEMITLLLPPESLFNPSDCFKPCGSTYVVMQGIAFVELPCIRQVRHNEKEKRCVSTITSLSPGGDMAQGQRYTVEECLAAVTKADAMRPENERNVEARIQEFHDWFNKTYGESESHDQVRLILEAFLPARPSVASKADDDPDQVKRGEKKQKTQHSLYPPMASQHSLHPPYGEDAPASAQ